MAEFKCEAHGVKEHYHYGMIMLFFNIKDLGEYYCSPFLLPTINSRNICLLVNIVVLPIYFDLVYSFANNPSFTIYIKNYYELRGENNDKFKY